MGASLSLSACSARAERVDEALTRPSGIYAPRADVDARKLRKLILGGKLVRARLAPALARTTASDAKCHAALSGV